MLVITLFEPGIEKWLQQCGIHAFRGKPEISVPALIISPEPIQAILLSNMYSQPPTIHELHF
jgi:hypothetical protein